MANARERIETLISENPVVLFMKGTPEFPQCGFSGQVIQILEYVGAPVVGVNVLEDAEIRQGVKEYANWPTIPQLYVKGEFVGGCDIVREMFQSGELASVLTDAGVRLKSAAGTDSPRGRPSRPGHRWARWLGFPGTLIARFHRNSLKPAQRMPPAFGACLDPSRPSRGTS